MTFEHYIGRRAMYNRTGECGYIKSFMGTMITMQTDTPGLEIGGLQDADITLLEDKEKKQKAPYQQGVEQGTWTQERFNAAGLDSPQAHLRRLEENYADEQRKLPSIRLDDPEYAARHAEFMEGMITAARRTLGALTQEHATLHEE